MSYKYKEFKNDFFVLGVIYGIFQ